MQRTWEYVRVAIVAFCTAMSVCVGEAGTVVLAQELGERPRQGSSGAPAGPQGQLTPTHDSSPHGIWLGRYTCGQGTFPLELVINVSPKRLEDPARSVHSVVSFDFAASGSVNRAILVMSGEYGPKMQMLRLTKVERFILHPPGLGEVLGYEGKFDPSNRKFLLSFRGTRHQCRILALSEASKPELRADAWQILGPYDRPLPRPERDAESPTSSPPDQTEAPLVLSPSTIADARKDEIIGDATTDSEVLIAQVPNPDIRLYALEPGKPLCTGKLVDVMLILVTKDAGVIEQFTSGQLDRVIVQLAPQYLGETLREGCKTDHAYVLSVLDDTPNDNDRKAHGLLGPSDYQRGAKLRMAQYRAMPDERGKYLWHRQPFESSRSIPSHLMRGAAERACKRALSGFQGPSDVAACMRDARKFGYPQSYLSFDLLADLKEMERLGLPGCVEAQNLVNKGLERLAHDLQLPASTRRFHCSEALQVLSGVIGTHEEELQSHLRCIGFSAGQLQSRQLLLEHFAKCMDVTGNNDLRRTIADVARSCRSDADVPRDLLTSYFPRALKGHEGWLNDYGLMMYERGIRDVVPSPFRCTEITELARDKGIVSAADFVQSVQQQEAAKADQIEIAERERKNKVAACTASGDRDKPPTADDVLKAANIALLARCGNPQAITRLLQGRVPPESAGGATLSLLFGAKLMVEEDRCAIKALASSTSLRFLAFDEVTCQRGLEFSFACTGKPYLDCRSNSDVAFGPGGLSSQSLECTVIEKLPSRMIEFGMRHDDDCTWQYLD